MSQYMRNPRQVAAALRALAEDVDAIGNVELPAMVVGLRVQLVSHGEADQASRTAAVDRIATGLDASTERKQMVSGGHHHGTGYDAERYGIEVDVFTALPELAAALTAGRPGR